jgi:hypothetical protein
VKQTINQSIILDEKVRVIDAEELRVGLVARGGMYVPPGARLHHGA